MRRWDTKVEDITQEGISADMAERIGDSENATARVDLSNLDP